ncbi:MAG: hypothetical protein PHQ86_02665 [Dehalococcoidales bacterium]|nr:hypothetical protein [Dehalococcoidales bacterium]
MKLVRIVLKTTLCLFLLFGIITNQACSSKPVNADEITDNLFHALIEGDYLEYILSLPKDCRCSIKNENDFNAELANINEQFGEYEANSLKYWKTEVEFDSIAVFYKAKFSKQPQVIVKTFFENTDGNIKFIRLWIEP